MAFDITTLLSLALSLSPSLSILSSSLSLSLSVCMSFILSINESPLDLTLFLFLSLTPPTLSGCSAPFGRIEQGRRAGFSSHYRERYYRPYT